MSDNIKQQEKRQLLCMHAWVLSPTICTCARGESESPLLVLQATDLAVIQSGWASTGLGLGRSRRSGCWQTPFKIWRETELVPASAMPWASKFDN